MFTGLVAGQGTLLGREPRGGDLRLHIDVSDCIDDPLMVGESVAVNGVCLTAASLEGLGFQADVSRETLAVTTLDNLKTGSRVNIERALKVGQPLGGHLVSGHVDGVGELRSVRKDARSWRMQFSAPANLLPYIAVKGSICVEGVSLTVNEVDAEGFGVNIVPHTAELTTMGRLQTGTLVNLEVDIIARYIERLLTGRGNASGHISESLLKELGYGGDNS